MTSWMELREYMLAKLLWNVDADPDSLLHDFCIHYYGLAAQPVEELYREMHRSLIASGKRLDIYGYPVDAADGYLAPTQIAKYQALIAAAYDSLQHTYTTPVMAFSPTRWYATASGTLNSPSTMPSSSSPWRVTCRWTALSCPEPTVLLPMANA